MIKNCSRLGNNLYFSNKAQHFINNQSKILQNNSFNLYNNNNINSQTNSQNKLIFKVKYNFWNKLFKSSQDSKPKQEKENLTEEEEFAKKQNLSGIHDIGQTGSWQNIGHLIEKMKKDNESRERIIPAKKLEDQDKLTVFVEMDEVLVYVFSPDEHETYMSAPERDYDHLFEYKEYDTYLSIYKRPYLQSFLQYLRENTEPILYCNGVQSYVEQVMDIVDPNKSFKHIICQEQGSTRIIDEKENIDDFFKDLNLTNRDLTRAVYIDSKALNFWSHPDNGLPVQEYLADSTQNDQELLHLIKFLDELKEVRDVREVLKERFQIKKALEESGML